MTKIRVKHVPDDVHRILQQRAQAAGQSVQEYVLEWFTELARRPSIDEWVDDIA